MVEERRERRKEKRESMRMIDRNDSEEKRAALLHTRARFNASLALPTETECEDLPARRSAWWNGGGVVGDGTEAFEKGRER